MTSLSAEDGRDLGGQPIGLQEHSWLAYGYEVADDLDQELDPLVKAVEVAMQGFAKASEPGAFWVDYFLILCYMPEWVLPGGVRWQPDHKGAYYCVCTPLQGCKQFHYAQTNKY
ncbi:hypothetical protein C8Q74DRAFT_1372754 [Fomes fomentarius]|nr:hypothetical protein C8Q74DRAFT_1372754 [Fomes fomentarius]